MQIAVATNAGGKGFIPSFGVGEKINKKLDKIFPGRKYTYDQPFEGAKRVCFSVDPPLYGYRKDGMRPNAQNSLQAKYQNIEGKTQVMIPVDINKVKEINIISEANKS